MKPIHIELTEEQLDLLQPFFDEAAEQNRDWTPGIIIAQIKPEGLNTNFIPTEPAKAFINIVSSYFKD